MSDAVTGPSYANTRDLNALRADLVRVRGAVDKAFQWIIGLLVAQVLADTALLILVNR